MNYVSNRTNNSPHMTAVDMIYIAGTCLYDPTGCDAADDLIAEISSDIFESERYAENPTLYMGDALHRLVQITAPEMLRLEHNKTDQQKYASASGPLSEEAQYCIEAVSNHEPVLVDHHTPNNYELYARDTDIVRNVRFELGSYYFNQMEAQLAAYKKASQDMHKLFNPQPEEASPARKTFKENLLSFFGWDKAAKKNKNGLNL